MGSGDPLFLAGPATDEVHVIPVRLEAGPPPRERQDETRRRLHAILAGYVDAPPAGLEIVADANGKPRLRGDPVRFNLSHSGELALVAVTADREVGVDVERVATHRDVARLAPGVLDREGAAAVAAAPAAEKARAFHLAWARREAVGKCAGTGLAGPPPEGPRQVHEVAVGKGYVAVVAVEGAEPVSVELRA